ncbi:single-stranded DNA-binding protein [Methanobrevibacter sp.]|uniref:single-stranded DNA-binding protein n=1 Tax=Methanobrevibacter sp. TaxID=66852 RepID=UPI00388D06B1
MKTDLNVVILEGRVARTPDLLYTKSGNALCKFDLVSGEVFKEYDGTEKIITNYVTINLWGKPAESLSKFLKKGKAIRVTGSLKQNTWNDKNEVRHDDVYVNATNIDFLS